jgi:multidrug efflux pump subunit AcrB
VGPISVGVILAVSSSLALSLTVILALAAIFLHPDAPKDVDGGPPRHPWRHGFSSPGLTALYRRSLVATLGRPWIGIAVSVTLPILGFLLVPALPEQFFPANDRDQFQVQLDLPPHASIEATLAAIERARRVIESHDEVVETHWFAGETTPRVYYNIMGNNDVPNFAGGFVVTRSPDATQALLPGLQEELIDAVPEAIAIALPFEQGPPFDAPIEVRIVGPELDRLRALGEQVRAILARTDAVTYTRAKLIGGRPKLVLATDEDAAQLAGLRLGEVADQLDAALEGASGGRVIEATQDIPIRVRAAEDDRASLVRIGSTRLIPTGVSSGGALGGVPVEAVATISLEPEMAGITRHLGERVNTVQAFLEPYALIQESLDDFVRRLDRSRLLLPEGYRIEFGGDFEQRTEAIADLAAFALPLLVLMAGSIILTFDSLRLASIIYAVGGLSIGLAMLSVWTFGHPLGFVVIVGAMGLAGLAINDAIVVLNALRLDPRSEKGEPGPTAEVVIDASRHIIATTLTTVGGFLPLILAGGRFWPPMATAIAGGVLGACSAPR